MVWDLRKLWSFPCPDFFFGDFDTFWLELDEVGLVLSLSFVVSFMLISKNHPRDFSLAQPVRLWLLHPFLDACLDIKIYSAHCRFIELEFAFWRLSRAVLCSILFLWERCLDEISLISCACLISMTLLYTALVWLEVEDRRDFMHALCACGGDCKVKSLFSPSWYVLATCWCLEVTI